MSDNKINNKNNVYCGNCGKYGHMYRNCKEAVISLGIINIVIDSDKNYENTLKSIMDNKIDNITSGIQCNTQDDAKNFSIYKNMIKFLLIKRKHTLGYIEFIRGRYRIDNVDGIIFLFQQMSKEEIIKIGQLEFDELWEELWSYDGKNISHETEYKLSKDKFNQLKYDDDNDLNLHFYVSSIVPKWDQAEWGFPKGRRNLYEINLDCAIREFEEESGYSKDDYVLLKNIDPIVEEFMGTNGIRYKHIYYISMTINHKYPIVHPTLDINNKHQVGEIGDIGLFTYDEAINLIRPYHIERKRLLTMLYMFILNKLMENELK